MFSALREIIADFAGPDPHLGLYGAFGYDLAFQFEPVRQRLNASPRPATWCCTCQTRSTCWTASGRQHRFSYDFETGGGRYRRAAGAGRPTASRRTRPG